MDLSQKIINKNKTIDPHGYFEHFKQDIAESQDRLIEILLEPYDQNIVSFENFEQVRDIMDGSDLSEEKVADVSEGFLPIRIWIMSAVQNLEAVFLEEEIHDLEK